MTLPVYPNSISFAQIRAEFNSGGTDSNVALSQYYAGGAYVTAGTQGYPNGGAATNIPSSGAISVNGFAGSQAGPVVQTLYEITLSGDQTAGSTAMGLAVDNSQNLYICGTGGYSYPLYGFLYKFNSSGTVQWQQQVSESGSTKFGECYYCVADNSGNMYVTGRANGDLSGYSQKPFVAQFSPSGALNWIGIYQNASLGYEPNISIDSSNNLYVTLQANTAAVIMKLDSAGSIQWSKQGYPGDGLGVYYGKFSAVDISNMVVVLNYDNSLNMLYLQKLTNNGVTIWAQEFSSGVALQASGLGIDSNNNYYIGAQASTTTGYIAKYNDSGGILWQNSVYNQAYAYCLLNALTAKSTYVYAAGETNVSGWLAGWVAKFDIDGNIVWATKFTQSGQDLVARNVCVDSAGNVYVSGVSYSDGRQFTFKLAADGSVSGTYNGITCSAFTDLAITTSLCTDTTVTWNPSTFISGVTTTNDITLTSPTPLTVTLTSIP